METIILSLLIACSAGMTIYFKYSNSKYGLYVLKPLTTILILVLSFISMRHSNLNGIIFLQLGFVFCLFGDIFLMLPHKFLPGLISFLVAHILFMIHFISNASSYKFLPIVPIVLIGVVLFLSLNKYLGKMRYPVIFYLIIILTMAYFGINNYIGSKAIPTILVLFAVVLFVFSDANIAFNKFKKPYKSAEFLILSTYYISIYLLALSLNY